MASGQLSDQHTSSSSQRNGRERARLTARSDDERDAAEARGPKELKRGQNCSVRVRVEGASAGLFSVRTLFELARWNDCAKSSPAGGGIDFSPGRTGVPQRAPFLRVLGSWVTWEIYPSPFRDDTVLTHALQARVDAAPENPSAVGTTHPRCFRIAPMGLQESR